MYIESKKEITKKQFEYLQNCDKKEFNDFIENEARNSPFPPMGYDFISPRILYDDNKYFIAWKHWNSCD